MTRSGEPAKRSRTAMLGAGAILGAALAPAAGLAAPAAAPLSFDGATLGMSIADWKSLAPPAGVGPDAAPTCAPAARPDARACSYDARFGHDLLPHSIQLDPRYRATSVRYLFVGGRLREIDFTASIDAYNDVTAMLDQAYGPPTQTTRDWTRTSMGRVARVRQTWRADAGAVTLVDPAADPVQLKVRFAGAGPAV